MSKIKVGDTVWVRGAVEEIAADGTWQVRMYPEGSHLTDAAWLAPFAALVERVGVEKMLSCLDDADIALRDWRDSLYDNGTPDDIRDAQEIEADAAMIRQMAAALRGEGAANG